MNLRLASLSLAIFVALAGTAKAQDLDFSKITCTQFDAGSKPEIGAILTWLEGYYAKKDAAPVLSSDKIVKDAQALTEYCKAHGDDNIIKASEAVMQAK
ncbi:MAG TPA: HdeA/HdeB family chaperone [Methylovirgula sp.]|nr:HdeA/HdeB family chaperone [Methylovirgula sp.]